MRCYFINRPDSPYFESDIFRKILIYVQEGTRLARLKQTGRMFLMVVDNISNMEDALRFLEHMHVYLFPVKVAEKSTEVSG